jgi:predicted DNA-binding transcriptional regulator AlpA
MVSKQVVVKAFGVTRDDDPELLTASEVSALTSIPVSSLHVYAQRRELGMPAEGPPHLRLGPRRRRWLRSSVVAWLRECEVVD